MAKLRFVRVGGSCQVVPRLYYCIAVSCSHAPLSIIVFLSNVLVHCYCPFSLFSDVFSSFSLCSDVFSPVFPVLLYSHLFSLFSDIFPSCSLCYDMLSSCSDVFSPVLSAAVFSPVLSLFCMFTGGELGAAMESRPDQDRTRP